MGGGGGGQTVFAGPSNLDVQPVVSIESQLRVYIAIPVERLSSAQTAAGGYQPYTYKWYWNGNLLLGGHRIHQVQVQWWQPNNNGCNFYTDDNWTGFSKMQEAISAQLQIQKSRCSSTEDTQEATLNVTYHNCK
jgi:hypothetical protein